jgi:Ala-tRNA(Pro) deacylase
VSIDRKEEVYSLFRQLGIEYRIVEHPPMFTQTDNEKHRINIGAMIFKNLFVRNKDKSRYYLLSLPLEKRADLLALQKLLGESRLSFGDEDTLSEKLNIRSGSVSFLNVIGAGDTNVTFLIDQSVFDHERIGVHPNDNTATVIIAPQDISKILDHCSAEYRFVELGSAFMQRV